MKIVSKVFLQHITTIKQKMVAKQSTYTKRSTPAGFILQWNLMSLASLKTNMNKIGILNLYSHVFMID